MRRSFDPSRRRRQDSLKTPPQRQRARGAPRAALPGYASLSQQLHLSAHGLIPVVIQDAKTQQVLTLCYLNRAAVRTSLQTGLVYVYRRSQHRLMQKGAISGHIQRIRQVRIDCEGNSLVFLVSQRVAACHAGYRTCYYRRLSPRGAVKTTDRRVFNPKTVYRTR